MWELVTILTGHNTDKHHIHLNQQTLIQTCVPILYMPSAKWTGITSHHTSGMIWELTVLKVWSLITMEGWHTITYFDNKCIFKTHNNKTNRVTTSGSWTFDPMTDLLRPLIEPLYYIAMLVDPTVILLVYIFCIWFAVEFVFWPSLSSTRQSQSCHSTLMNLLWTLTSVLTGKQNWKQLTCTRSFFMRWNK